MRSAALLSILAAIPGCIQSDTCTTWHYDADGDGYSGEESLSCDPPEGAIEGPIDGTIDCDDQDGTVYPGAADGSEGCDGVDNNCDGQIDEEITSSTWYADQDEDGYGAGDGQTLTSCDATTGLVAVGSSAVTVLDAVLLT